MSRHLDDTRTGHPILRFLDLLEDGLDDIKDTPAWSLNAQETTQVVTRLTRTCHGWPRSRPAPSPSPDPRPTRSDRCEGSDAVAARVTMMTSGEAGRHTKLAKTLAAHDQTRQALAAGEVLAEQAAAIGVAIDNLDEDFAAEAVRAEALLIAEAADHDAYDVAGDGPQAVRDHRPRRRRSPRSQSVGRPRRNGRRRGPSCGWPTTATAPSAGRSSCPRCRPRCSAKPSKPSPHPNTSCHRRCRRLRPREAHPTQDGSGVHRVHRTLPTLQPAEDGRDGSHDHRHRRRRRLHRRPHRRSSEGGSHPGRHRCLTRPAPAPGLRGKGHARRAGQGRSRPRPR